MRRNGIIGILMDQAVIPEEGVVIDFLGRPAWTIKIPAIMARRLKPAVIPAFMHREGNRRIGTFHPEVVLCGDPDAEKAMIEDTRRLSGYIENYIREHPEEWLWIHRRGSGPESGGKIEDRLKRTMTNCRKDNYLAGQVVAGTFRRPFYGKDFVEPDGLCGARSC